MARNKSMSFLQHVEELRWHLVRSVIAILIFASCAFVFSDIIFDSIILAPKNADFISNRLFAKLGELLNTEALKINTKPLQIININMAGQFTTHITISIIVGLVIGFPYVFYQFWKFIKPALYIKERKYARLSVFYASSLFSLGVLFGYFLIVPLSIHFLGTYNVSDQILNQINLKSYISSVNSIILASGVIFELPIIIYFLSKVGIITPITLKKYRKHSLIGMLIVSAIITPPDVFSQVLVCLPLIILYEIGIKISKRIVRKREEYLNK